MGRRDEMQKKETSEEGTRDLSMGGLVIDLRSEGRGWNGKKAIDNVCFASSKRNPVAFALDTK